MTMTGDGFHQRHSNPTPLSPRLPDTIVSPSMNLSISLDVNEQRNGGSKSVRGAPAGSLGILLNRRTGFL